jgi:hypothetical protein
MPDRHFEVTRIFPGGVKETIFVVAKKLSMSDTMLLLEDGQKCVLVMPIAHLWELKEIKDAN